MPQKFLTVFIILIIACDLPAQNSTPEKLPADTPPDERVMVSHRTKDGWSIPAPIRIRGLNAGGVVGNYLVIDYAFGPDQRTLIISVMRDSTLGGRDLYVSFLDDSLTTW